METKQQMIARRDKSRKVQSKRRKRMDKYLPVIEKKLTKSAEIELGLTALMVHRQPGEVLSLSDIADVCNCSSKVLINITGYAIKKLKSSYLVDYLQ